MLLSILPAALIRALGGYIYMDGFLSDGVRDLISVVSFLLAIGGTSVSAFKLFQKFGKEKSHQVNLRNEDSRSLFRVVWQFLQSPNDKDVIDSKDARGEFYSGFGCLAVASLFSLLCSFKHEWCGTLIMLSFVATIFELFSFSEAFSAIDSWLGKNETTRRHQLSWKIVAYGCWLSSILLFPLLLALPTVVNTHVGFVLAMHTINLIIITLFVVIAWIGTYIKEKLFD